MLTSVQVRIRVWKHSGNIHSNRKVQVHGYHREWYNITGILHHQKIQKYNIRMDIQKLRGTREQQEGPREPIRRRTWRKSYDDVQASATPWSPLKDPLRTLISYSKATTVQALESGHENPELSDATLRVHIIKPSGVHKRQSHVYMIKWCGPGMQIQAMTSNIKKIKWTTVNHVYQ